jgi:hypothetical protein
VPGKQYPLLVVADLPEIVVVQADHAETLVYFETRHVVDFTSQRGNRFGKRHGTPPRGDARITGR